MIGNVELHSEGREKSHFLHGFHFKIFKYYEAKFFEFHKKKKKEKGPRFAP